jgi:hypothetical protein
MSDAPSTTLPSIPDTSTILNKALADIITQATSGAAQAKQFLIDQVPDVVKQLLVFNEIWSAFLVFMGIAFMCSFVYCVKKCFINDWSENEHIGKSVVLMISTMISGIAGLALFFANIKGLLMLIFAPKIWLLDYSIALIHNH